MKDAGRLNIWNHKVNNSNELELEKPQFQLGLFSVSKGGLDTSAKLLHLF